MQASLTPAAQPVRVPCNPAGCGTTRGEVGAGNRRRRLITPELSSQGLQLVDQRRCSWSTAGRARAVAGACTPLSRARTVQLWVTRSSACCASTLVAQLTLKHLVSKVFFPELQTPATPIRVDPPPLIISLSQRGKSEPEICQVEGGMWLNLPQFRGEKSLRDDA
jgi:hypothetical protein